MRGVTAAVLILGSLAVSAQSPDVLAQVGVSPLSAKVAIDSVLNSGVYNPGLPGAAFKLMPPAARADAATAGVAWLQAYVASAAFRQQYEGIRLSHKPAAPEFTGTPEDELKKEDAEQRQQAEESKTALAALPAAQRAQVEAAMKAAQTMAARSNTPEMRKTRLEAIQAGRVERTTQYEQELANWSRSFPENPAPLIAKRLREFLALSADVDFAASLTPRNGKMVYEHAAYEQKPAPWKLCFRAGREATTAARAAVQSWLTALGG